MEKNKKTMKDRIFDYINNFGSITTFQAFQDLGCSRLSEYIRQLRLEYEINDVWEKTTNRYGDKVEYKRYFFKTNESKEQRKELI